MNRILFDENAPDTFLLQKSDERCQHILRVLKSREGDVLEAGRINGMQGKAIVREISAEGIRLDLDLTQPPTKPYPVDLILGAVRPITAKRLIKDLATQGIRQIFLTATALSEKSYFKSRLWQTEEWRRYLVDGAQQAGTTIIPKVSRHYSLRRALEALEEVRSQPMNRWALDNLQPEGPLSKAVPHSEETVLAIGAERGWTDAEREELAAARFGIFSMGQRILRTETACTAALTLALGRMELFN